MFGRESRGNGAVGTEGVERVEIEKIKEPQASIY